MSVFKNKSDLENYFQQFRKNIVGIDASFKSPCGTKDIIYTDSYILVFTKPVLIPDSCIQTESCCCIGIITIK